jgi:hypothetical protein
MTDNTLVGKPLEMRFDKEFHENKILISLNGPANADNGNGMNGNE